jgi:hypothetical protein
MGQAAEKGSLDRRPLRQKIEKPLLNLFQLRIDAEIGRP